MSDLAALIEAYHLNLTSFKRQSPMKDRQEWIMFQRDRFQKCLNRFPLHPLFKQGEAILQLLMQSEKLADLFPKQRKRDLKATSKISETLIGDTTKECISPKTSSTSCNYCKKLENALNRLLNENMALKESNKKPPKEVHTAQGRVQRLNVQQNQFTNVVLLQDDGSQLCLDVWRKIDQDSLSIGQIIKVEGTISEYNGRKKISCGKDSKIEILKHSESFQSTSSAVNNDIKVLFSPLAQKYGNACNLCGMTGHWKNECPKRKCG